MRPHPLAACLVAASASLGLLSNASAGVVLFERGAGESLASAEVTIDSALNALDRIDGRLSQSAVDTQRYAVDLFKIFVPDTAAFSATATSTFGNADDWALFLFSSTGLGLQANDDSLGLDPALSAFGGAADFYYLGIGLGGFTAQDSALLNIFDVFNGMQLDAAAGALAGWTDGGASTLGQDRFYSINFSGAVVAQVPAPAGPALVAGLLLAAIGARRRGAAQRG